MIRVLTALRPVYRAETGKRRGRLTLRAAYLDAAWEAWRAKHWADGCGCEHSPTGHTCLWHRTDSECGRDEDLYKARRRLIDRLARWLMWRDREAIARTKREAKAKTAGHRCWWKSCAQCNPVTEVTT